MRGVLGSMEAVVPVLLCKMELPWGALGDVLADYPAHFVSEWLSGDCIAGSVSRSRSGFRAGRVRPTWLPVGSG